MKSSPAEQGDPNAPILFLAEAPSFVEIRMGYPLAGPSGDVYNECLHAAGLIRHDAYILNLWPFQVGKDEKRGVMFVKDRPSVILYNKKGLTEAGWDAARPQLEKASQCGAVQVVTLGRPAFEAALDNHPRVKVVGPKIMKWRGSPLWSDRLGKKVIPTIHPAATIHGTYLWRYLIIADMQKAARHVEHGSKLILPDRKIILDPSFEDVIEYMEYMRENGRVATDLEAINQQLNCFCLCPNALEGMVVPIADEFGNSWWTLEDEAEILLAYARLMGNPDVQKINQNLVSFDSMYLLWRNNIYCQGDCDDNMIAQKIMYPEFPKGLDFQTSIHTDEPYYKDEGKMWKGTGGDIEQWWLYNGKDGCTSIECWDALSKEMTDKEYWSTYYRVRNRRRFLSYMAIRGFRVNHERMQEVHTRVSAQLEAKEAELESVARYPFNVSSPKQCQLYFYGTLGYKPYTSKTGGITTDDKAMARIYRKYGSPEAKLVQEIRALRKLKSTYLEVTWDEDMRLRCSWDATGTMFGRLSSSQTLWGTGLNMQNLHPEFKEFLVADEEELKEPML
jgi:uracil-DNA glycosylase